jgi:dynein assembly factor 1
MVYGLVAGIPKLHTLEISRNRLTSVADISHLLLCKTITVLDLSYNRLHDARCVTVWEGMPNLHVIYLQGNPATQKIADTWGSYRKYVLARLPALTFLDERPVILLSRIVSNFRNSSPPGCPASAAAA